MPDTDWAGLLSDVQFTLALNNFTDFRFDGNPKKSRRFISWVYLRVYLRNKKFDFRLATLPSVVPGPKKLEIFFTDFSDLGKLPPRAIETCRYMKIFIFRYRLVQ